MFTKKYDLSHWVLHKCDYGFEDFAGHDCRGGIKKRLMVHPFEGEKKQLLLFKTKNARVPAVFASYGDKLTKRKIQTTLSPVLIFKKFKKGHKTNLCNM